MPNGAGTSARAPRRLVAGAGARLPRDPGLRPAPRPHRAPLAGAARDGRAGLDDRGLRRPRLGPGARPPGGGARASRRASGRRSTAIAARSGRTAGGGRGGRRARHRRGGAVSEALLHLVAAHGPVLVLAAALLSSAGLPVPGSLSLLAAGAFAAGGEMRLAEIAAAGLGGRDGRRPGRLLGRGAGRAARARLGDPARHGRGDRARPRLLAALGRRRQLLLPLAGQPARAGDQPGQRGDRGALGALQPLLPARRDGLGGALCRARPRLQPLDPGDRPARERPRPLPGGGRRGGRCSRCGCARTAAPPGRERGAGLRRPAAAATRIRPFGTHRWRGR